MAFPFRILSDGSVASVEHRSNEEAAQLLVALTMTQRGELPLAPHFGMNDPTFGTPDPGEIAASAAVFLPDVFIQDIRVTDPNAEGKVRLEIDYRV